MKKVWQFFRCGAALLILLEMIEWMLGNRKRSPLKVKVSVDKTDAVYNENELLVWRKPGVTDEQFEAWKKDNLEVYSHLKRKSICGNCDKSLELWEGPDVSTFVVEKVASASNTAAGNPVGGDDDTTYFSYNLSISLPEPEWNICKSDDYKPDTRNLPEQPVVTGSPVIVAVLDTGVMPIIKARYTSQVPSCINEGEMGWNFTDPNAGTDTADDHQRHHGSKVSRFIIDQQRKYAKRSVNILPVKIHNREGKSTLFDVLCAFAYAARSGAHIINASFGFYAGRRSEPPALLAAFVQRLLTANNILLVAAAGNANPEDDGRFLQHSGNNPRNLDHHPFYPACLAKSLENVLAVTTISNVVKTVSPSQNFSNTIVDIGVDGDRILEGDYKFQDPMDSANYIVGSSYAAPIITGKIAQYYSELMRVMPPGSRINKTLLLNEMKRLGLIKRENRSPLAKFVRSGNYSTK